MTKATHPVPLIRGEKIWLRAMERRDLEAFERGRNDLEIGYSAGYHAPTGMVNLERWYEKLMSESYSKDGYYFTICLLGSEEAIGFAWLWHLDLVNCNAEFSIFLSNKDQFGKGLGTDALNAVLDFGFAELPLERIYLEVETKNKRAIRSYEKSGMVPEGRLRNARRRQGGFVDAVVMSMLRNDWKSLTRPKSWELSN